ncbi:hypothetical protein [Nostoc sp. EfeVER01]|uniref:hypothetical protein n=1 Tax=Nostoc sp. EfeVER01 TaxID=3075406 RepID=UPI003919396A
MLKILETTPNRLVIKSEIKNFDTKKRVLFIYVAIYFLLISTFKKWTIFGLSQKAVTSIYQSLSLSTRHRKKGSEIKIAIALDSVHSES